MTQKQFYFYKTKDVLNAIETLEYTLDLSEADIREIIKEFIKRLAAKSDEILDRVREINEEEYITARTYIINHLRIEF